jgi:hypothetical protein
MVIRLPIFEVLFLVGVALSSGIFLGTINAPRDNARWKDALKRAGAVLGLFLVPAAIFYLAFPYTPNALDWLFGKVYHFVLGG